MQSTRISRPLLALALGLPAMLALPSHAAPRKAAPRPSKNPNPVVRLQLLPASLTFANRRDTRRSLVLGILKNGEQMDLTPAAKLQPVGGLVQPDSDGYLTPMKVGKGVVRVAASGLTASLPVEVKSVAAPPVSFIRDVAPIMSKVG